MSSPEIVSTRITGTGRAGTSLRRRVPVLALALLMFAFAAFYPYMEATGSCGDPGCPEFSHVHAPAPAELPPGTLVAVLAAAPAPALAGRIRRRPASDRRPAEVHLSPEPKPPRP